MRVHLTSSRPILLTWIAGLYLVVTAAPAHAEIVFFATGRNLSIKSHRLDGDSLVLTLRQGGEIICDPSAIARIEPDEVPYPEPEKAVSSEQAPPPFTPYGEIIDRVSAAHGVSARLVRAVIEVESGYQERARSRKGAMGLMQLMPDTARQYAVRDPYEPSTNIEAGIRHLKFLLTRFDLPLALAAYNAGEAAVRRFNGVPPYPETRDYVARVMRAMGR